MYVLLEFFLLVCISLKIYIYRSIRTLYGNVNFWEKKKEKKKKEYVSRIEYKILKISKIFFEDSFLKREKR